ncbi:hypothetical protein ABW19_dt0202050 [Dactylella cylindrospora]|nr:hypothetical protein ABW19_dt0202050 [Dactylella cylindrospora]
MDPPENAAPDGHSNPPPVSAQDLIRNQAADAQNNNGSHAEGILNRNFGIAESYSREGAGMPPGYRVSRHHPSAPFTDRPASSHHLHARSSRAGQSRRAPSPTFFGRPESSGRRHSESHSHRHPESNSHRHHESNSHRRPESNGRQHHGSNNPLHPIFDGPPHPSHNVPSYPGFFSEMPPHRPHRRSSAPPHRDPIFSIYSPNDPNSFLLGVVPPVYIDAAYFGFWRDPVTQESIPVVPDPDVEGMIGATFVPGVVWVDSSPHGSHHAHPSHLGGRY